ncbi:MAG: beta-N-acetylhexosaminidase [Clostridia bacterium]|nr:beta-N-acetylhexosaminidase [Clostridia bacterium]
MKRFGVMIDMSRNAVMRPDELKKFIKQLADFGYNMVQLYTEDTYEIKEEPYFGYLRGRYTKEDLKDIVAYAAELGVEIIPCIQTLGHLEGIFKWAPYTEINDAGAILLVGEERTYELIERMFATIRECFTTEIAHIGMDEAWTLGLGKYLAKHGFENRFDILSRHLKRVLEIAKKYNFKPIIWSDMFFRLANPDGGYYGWENITDDVVKSCPDDIGLVYWDYYHNEKKYYDGMLAAHNKFGKEVWFAGGAWTWIGLAPYTSFTIDSMQKAMLSCREQNIDNIMLTMWGDNGKECSNWSLLPALFKVKRFYDGVTDMDEIRREFKELTGEDYDAMLDLELPNMVAGNNRDCPSNISKTMLYSDPLLGFLDVTVKEGVSEEFTKHKFKLLDHARNSKRFSYLFEVEAALADVLEIKYDLGVRTRTAYKLGDKTALEALIPEYEECARRVKKLHNLFSIQWHKENRPHGFEVHDSRFGGIILRLEACVKRIKAYLNGTVEKLEELEEELLPYALAKDKYFAIEGIPGTEGIPALDRHSYAFTVSRED